MGIRPVCDRCGEELQDFGAILFSPPEDSEVRKYHICVNCYGEIIESFD